MVGKVTGYKAEDIGAKIYMARGQKEIVGFDPAKFMLSPQNA